jgi:hypothetical protein
VKSGLYREEDVLKNEISADLKIEGLIGEQKLENSLKTIRSDN